MDPIKKNGDSTEASAKMSDPIWTKMCRNLSFASPPLGDLLVVALDSAGERIWNNDTV